MCITENSWESLALTDGCIGPRRAPPLRRLVYAPVGSRECTLRWCIKRFTSITHPPHSAAWDGNGPRMIEQCISSVGHFAMPGIVDESLVEALAAEVKARRTEMDISQAELGSRAQMGALFVKRIESGRNQPSISAFVRIAGGLNVPAPELLKAVLLRQNRSRRRMGG